MLQSSSSKRITLGKYSKYLNCPKCKQLFVEPRRLYPCSDTFCLACVPQGKCSLCNKKIIAVQQDNTATGLINEIAVQCLNSECPWKGTYEEYIKFHKKACNLKQKSIEEWLEEIKQSIIDNTVQKRVPDEEKEIAKENQLPMRAPLVAVVDDANDGVFRKKLRGVGEDDEENEQENGIGGGGV